MVGSRTGNDETPLLQREGAIQSDDIAKSFERIRTNIALPKSPLRSNLYQLPDIATV
jgi:hypothetical protein